MKLLLDVAEACFHILFTERRRACAELRILLGRQREKFCKLLRIYFTRDRNLSKGEPHALIDDQHDAIRRLDSGRDLYIVIAVVIEDFPE